MDKARSRFAFPSPFTGKVDFAGASQAKDGRGVRCLLQGLEKTGREFPPSVTPLTRHDTFPVNGEGRNLFDV
jgi:hypothetical protein